ncbi:MAG: toxin-antitoxin system, antitoxin component [Proteobacteria bacterium]|nr:toxin-antitoxin system, antitoxin component [Desulfobacteraceae bacterium]MBU4013865.1 toxin-antitoxin system, antitoxin component [Pseudomonadota bacterium]MBU4068202.1 toxin-antitoxin system, antitoxin component [Pseudomonadota bacterium]MBU4100009.1 toxin-antitoxin system, antitoxin component [Pseudomonadota bacterium]MBU4125933.1 toxin-antitoxin system, antitoxin component [Pseudomonadota bacterium]
MPAQNPRINVVLENSLYQKVRLLAEKDNVSLSAKVRDLLKEALEIQEDIALSVFAEKREKSWNDSEALTHNDVWS